MNIPVYTIDGQKVDDIAIRLADIKITPFEFSRAIRVYEFALHQGTKKAKTRGEVAFSKRKPWPQKHTGRARAGTRGSPIWVGGGVAHGPKPYTRRLSLNKKERKRVFTYMFAQKVAEGQVFALRYDKKDPLSVKQAVEFLRHVGLLPFKGYYVAPMDDTSSVLGFRNLEKVEIRRAPLLSIFDLYKKRYLLINEDALDQLTSRLITEDEKA